MLEHHNNQYSIVRINMSMLGIDGFCSCSRRPGNSSSLSVTRLLLLLVVIFRMLMVLCAHVCRVSSFSCLVVPSVLVL